MPKLVPKFVKLTVNEIRNTLVPDLFFLSAVAMVNKVIKFPTAPKPIHMK